MKPSGYCACLPCVSVGFLWVILFPPNSHVCRQSVGRLAMLKYHWCVFLPHTQCSWVRLWIHHDPEQDKAVTQDGLKSE